MTPIGIRQELVQILGLDLIGPDCDSELRSEILPQAPSRWYLTGFLVPIDAAEEQKIDEAATEEVDEVSDAVGTDDAATPEPAAARRAVFPSSMGLSPLVPKDAKELHVTVRWGDYQPLHRAEGEEHEGGDGNGWRYRWPDDFRDEVLARLLELNKQRAQQEALAGPAERPKKDGKKKAPRQPPNAPGLFGPGAS
jgi:hypothetical protein